MHSQYWLDFKAQQEKHSLSNIFSSTLWCWFFGFVFRKLLRNLTQVLLICPGLEMNSLKIEQGGILAQNEAKTWDSENSSEVQRTGRGCADGQLYCHRRLFLTSPYNLHFFPLGVYRCQWCNRETVRNRNNFRTEITHYFCHLGEGRTRLWRIEVLRMTKSSPCLKEPAVGMIGNRKQTLEACGEIHSAQTI